MTEKLLETLGEVQHALSEWRRTKPTRKIPAPIARSAAALHGRYRTNELLRELKIDHRTLMRWKAEFAGTTPSPSPTAPAPTSNKQSTPRSGTQKPTFVALPTSLSAAPTLEAPVALKLSSQREDGKVLTLEGTLTLSQWRSALMLLSAPESTR